MSMSEILGEMVRRSREEERGRQPQLSPPLAEAQVMMLREALSRYRAAASRFLVGDLVTPIEGMNSMRGAGVPHIVLEIRDADPEFRAGEPSRIDFGCRYDLRVLSWTSGEYCAFWVESWCFELWRGEGNDHSSSGDED